MSDRDDFGAFLIGFVVGGLTGAVVALLFAPQSGAETRTVIQEKAIELKDKASANFDEAYAQAESALAEARARFDELTQMTRERTEELQHRGQVLLEEQKTRLGEALARRKGEPKATEAAEGGEAEAPAA